MAGHTAIILFVIIQCVCPCGSTRFMKFMYKPYGPKMCTEWCKASDDSFLYIKEDLCCRRIPAKDANITKTEYSFACWKNSTRKKSSIPLAVLPEYKTCDSSFEGDLETRLNDSLHQACMEGNLCRVQYILSKRLSYINSLGMLGRSPVMVAARHGQVAVFEYLVSQGCDLASVDAHNNNLLHLACIGGNADIVRKLVSNMQFDINDKGQNGWSPVIMAVFFGYTDVFDFLLSKGCNLPMSGENQYNILHVACGGGYVHMVKHILSRGMYDIDSRTTDGETPLLTAADKGRIKVFDFLVSQGCNVNSLDTFKRNALQTACSAGKEELVRHILGKEMYDIESSDLHGQTPVLNAAKNGHIAVVDLLIDKGCSVEVVDKYMNNILHVACIYGHVEMVAHIVSQHFADIDSKGWLGQTAALLAVRFGHIKVVELLVSKGCDLNAIDKNKDNVLHVACRDGRLDIVEYFLSHGLPGEDSRGYLGLTPLMIAAKCGHKEVFFKLVDAGCSVSAVDDEKNNIYHFACLGGNVDIVRYLLSHGISGKDSEGYNGMTPIMVAEKFGHKELVKMFLGKLTSH